MVNLNRLQPGAVYSYEEGDLALVAQVAPGGDVGVFRDTKEPLEYVLQSSEPLFRLTLVERDLKKKWKSRGVFELSPRLRGYQKYSLREIYPEKWFLIDLRDLDSKVEVSKDEASNYEEFAGWATHHVIDRIRGVSVL